MNVEVQPTREAAIERLCERIVAARPRSLTLTGGTTAGDAYRLLASLAWRGRLDWSSLTLYFGDERRVPPDSADSCYRLAADTLLTSVRPAGVERMRGEAPDADAEAARYGALVPDRLDVTLLGMGADGHCASLFPGEPSLDVRDRLCVPSRAHYDPYERLTLTLPALDRSALVLFLALGASKADALAAIARGEDRPAGRVRPSDGEVVWIVDREAAAGL